MNMNYTIEKKQKQNVYLTAMHTIELKKTSFMIYLVENAVVFVEQLYT
jgi:hypothetical protein